VVGTCSTHVRIHRRSRHRFGFYRGRSRSAEAEDCENVPLVCLSVCGQTTSEGIRLVERSTTGTDWVDEVEAGWTDSTTGEWGKPPRRKPSPSKVSRVRIPSSAPSSQVRRSFLNPDET
jgi:hypothetical protein